MGKCQFRSLPNKDTLTLILRPSLSQRTIFMQRERAWEQVFPHVSITKGPFSGKIISSKWRGIYGWVGAPKRKETRSGYSLKQHRTTCTIPLSLL